MKKVNLAFLGLLLFAMNSCKKVEKAEITIPKVLNVSTLAGSGTNAGAGLFGYADGPGKLAAFQAPFGIVLDPSGNIIVADKDNHCIRKITQDGTVSTLAGKGTESGFANGTGSAARFNQPYYLACDANGNIYVADAGNNCIRKVTPSGEVSTVAGSTYGYVDGTGTAAKFVYPTGVTIDASNNLYVTDHDNHRIRKVTPSGVVTTIAGTGSQGQSDGPAGTSKVNAPFSLTIDKNGDLFFIEDGKSTIRKLSTDGIISTYINAIGGGGFYNGQIQITKLTFPDDLKIDNQGNMYIADTNNRIIRKVSLENGLMVSSTYAGIQTNPAPAGWFADGLADKAKFTLPSGLAIDKNTGDIYVSDLNAARIRKISLIDDPAFIPAPPEETARKNWNNPESWK